MIILPHDNGGLVAGLGWTPATKAPLFRRGRQAGDTPLNTLSLTLIPGKGKRGKSTKRQGPSAGRMTGPVKGSCPWQAGRLWSLAALATAWTGPDGYGVVKLTDTESVFFATRGGIPALGGDICGTADDMQTVLEAFLALTPPPPDGWQVASTPAAPALPADILPPNRRNWPARYRLTCPARTHRRLLIIAPTVVCTGMVALWGLQSWRDWSAEQARLAQEKLAAMIPAGDAAPEIRYLPHPWIGQPAPAEMVNLCEQALVALPRYLARWPLTGAECRADGIMASWQRPDDRQVTANDFVRAVTALPGGVTPFVDDDGNTAQTSHALPASMPDSGEVGLPGAEALRITLLSFFQSRGLPPTLTTVPPDPAPQEEGVTWVQDWQALSFSHDTPYPPSVQLAGLPLRGLRLSRVGMALNGTGTSLTWSYDITAYSRNPDAPARQEEGNTP